MFDWKDNKTLPQETHSVRVADACLAENGKRLVTLGHDGVLRIKETVSGKLIEEVRLLSDAQLKEDQPWGAHRRGTASVSTSDDADRLLVDCGAGTASIFDFEGIHKGEFQVLRVLHRSEAPIFAQDGRFVFTFDKKSISVIAVGAIGNRQVFACNGPFLGIAIDDERGIIATGHTGGGVACWTLGETGTLKENWWHLPSERT